MSKIKKIELEFDSEEIMDNWMKGCESWDIEVERLELKNWVCEKLKLERSDWYFKKYEISVEWESRRGLLVNKEGNREIEIEVVFW